MSSLLDSLKSLKDKLNEIENADITEVVKEEIPTDNSELIKQRLQEFKSFQSSKVTVNVGGVYYSFSHKTLSNPKLLNIFVNSQDTTIFYDGSPNLFKYISLIFRLFSNENDTEASKTIKIKLNEDELILKEMIKQVFINPDDVLAIIVIERETLPEPTVTVNPTENNNNNNANAGGYNNYNARGYGY